MLNITERHLEEFAAASRRAAAYGLMKCSSGNLSWRIDEARVLMTASRSWMAELTPDQVAIVDYATGEPVNGTTPTVESDFHLGILEARPDERVVLHFQSPAATAIACGQPMDLDFYVLPEMAYYIGPVAIVPFELPGSEALADAVVDAMETHNLAILRNHGQVTVGASFDEAIQRAVFFEMACDVLLRGGASVRPLSEQAVQALRDMAAQRRPGKV